MKPLYFGEEVGIHGLKITLIRSTRRNQGPCRMPAAEGEPLLNRASRTSVSACRRHPMSYDNHRARWGCVQNRVDSSSWKSRAWAPVCLAVQVAAASAMWSRPAASSGLKCAIPRLTLRRLLATAS